MAELRKENSVHGLNRRRQKEAFAGHPCMAVSKQCSVGVPLHTFLDCSAGLEPSVRHRGSHLAPSVGWGTEP